MSKRLSQLYELRKHGNEYHNLNYVSQSYVDSLLEEFTGQKRVISFYDPSGSLPSDPHHSDRYVASDDGNDGTKDYIYEYDGAEGIETQPKYGSVLLNEDDNLFYVYDESNGLLFENILKHNELDSIKGSSEGYHLQETAYENLKNQDQPVETTDSVTFDDITVSNPSDIYTSLNHDDFNDYVSNEHIDHSDVSITTDGILSGGGDLTSSRTITLNNSDITHNDVSGIQGSSEGYHLSESEYNNLDGTDQSLSTTDSVTFDDITVSNPSDIYTSLNHDDFNDYVSNEHIDGTSDQEGTHTIHDGNIISDNITQHEGDITHNNLGGLDGGGTTYYYHLKQTAYDNLKDQDQKLYKSSSPKFANVTSNNSPTDGDHLVRKDYVDAIAEDSSLSFEDGVIDFHDPESDGFPVDPSDGDRYISESTYYEDETEWYENYIYEYSDGDGLEFIPEHGGTLLVENESKLYYFHEDDNKGILLMNFVDHNNLSGIQGGSGDNRYHLNNTEHGYLSGQDQSVYTTSSPTFDDLSIDNPSNIYDDIDHNKLKNYDSDKHIDGTITGSKQIHNDRINIDTRNLSDVQDTVPSNGDALVWNDSESRYEPSNNNYYLTDVSGDGNSEVTFTVSGTDDVTKDFSHIHNNLESTTIDFNEEYDNGSVSSDTTIDWSNGNNQVITLEDDVELSFSNMGVGHKQLRINMDSTGGGSVTFPTGKGQDGEVGTLNKDADAINILSIFYNGSDYYFMLTTGWA